MKLGVCYYPEQWDESLWATDARRMADMGLSTVRIAEFAWALIEPRPGHFEWDWLDRIIDLLAQNGLEVVLGTPTAAPPHWLSDLHPDVLAVDAQGRTKAFGGRRHYSFSSLAFFEASQRVVTAMAQRYGRHSAVVAWQTDNEYGCHDTALSYCASARQRFRQWLAAKYGDIASLNRAWGNVFWSMSYASFDDVGFPVLTPAQPNPSHLLAFRRFASDEVLRYNRMQVDILRAHAPGRDVLHNFMAFFSEFDHHEMGHDLDVAAWDSYPLGFLDSSLLVSDSDRLTFRRSGHPDVAAFHHDLYRGLCKSRWWVVEQQPGPVNWAAWNAVPLPGMVRAWTWEAFAHGAELVSYFRWRQVPYAQEQMHAGLNTPDNRLDVGGQEASVVARELRDLQSKRGMPLGNVQRAPVALVVDYATKWMADALPHARDFSVQALALGWYSALRRHGLDIDIVNAASDFTGYALVVVPTLAQLDDDFVQRLQSSRAQLVFGPRSGSKTAELRIPEGLPPGALRRLLPGLRVTGVEGLRPGAHLGIHADSVHEASGSLVPLDGAEVTRWRDLLDAPAPLIVEARFPDGLPALVRHERTHYVAGWIDDAALDRLMGDAASRAGLSPVALPHGLRLRRRGPLQFAIHYGQQPVQVPAPANARFVLGGATLEPAGVAAWHVPTEIPGA